MCATFQFRKQVFQPGKEVVAVVDAVSEKPASRTGTGLQSPYPGRKSPQLTVNMKPNGKSRLILLAWLVSALAHAAEPRKPLNLLFIITDQQRWDALGCAGNPVLKTPNLDRLAKEGVRFTRFYSACPVCSPARTTILTGCSIGTHKVFDNKDITRTTPG